MRRGVRVGKFLNQQREFGTQCLNSFNYSGLRMCFYLISKGLMRINRDYKFEVIQ